jgi:hypothetical protein
VEAAAGLGGVRKRTRPHVPVEGGVGRFTDSTTVEDYHDDAVQVAGRSGNVTVQPDMDRRLSLFAYAEADS